MERFITMLVVSAALAVVLIYGANELTKNQVALEHAKAQTITARLQAQGQARLDTAMAVAVVASAVFPWLVLAGITSIALTAVVMRFKITSSETIFILQEGQSSRQIWEMLSRGRPTIIDERSQNASIRDGIRSMVKRSR